MNQATRFLWAVAAVVLLSAPFSRSAANAETSLQRQIMEQKAFAEPLLWVGEGEPPAEESREVLAALHEIKPGQVAGGISRLEEFLVRNTNSMWNPSILANLADYHRRTGRYTRALAYWDSAWKQLQGRSGANATAVGDYVLARWLRLMASLGRSDEMKGVIAEIGDRKMSRLEWQKSLVELKQAVEIMEREPGVSFRCGTFALFHVGNKLQKDNISLASIHQLPSPVSGFSLASLDEIARTNGLSMKWYRRGETGELVVPSVVHWRQNHYAAITDQRGDVYEVIDPTFGKKQWLHRDVIIEEASGYFMVPDGKQVAGWSPVTTEIASSTFGRGYPNIDDGPPVPPCTTCPCPPGTGGGGGGGGGGSGCGGGRCGPGMPWWQVSEPETSLALYDTPMLYQPALGGQMSFGLSYRQRETRTTNDVPSLGPYWSSSWVEYLDVTPDFFIVNFDHFDAVRFVGNGGGGWEYAGSHLLNGTAYEPRLGTKLERFWNSTSNLLEGFTLTEPNGDQRHYRFTNMVDVSSGKVRAFMTEHVVFPGYTNRYIYKVTNSLTKLVAVVDADGNTNTVDYQDANFPLQITKVTNPFGNYATFAYASSGLLTNITDVVGLSTGFTYDDTRISLPELTVMRTPYGNSTFKYTGLSGSSLFGESNMNGVGRSVLVTEPNGANHLFIYRDQNQTNGAALDSATAPATISSHNYLFDTPAYYRNSFYWGPRQYSLLSTTNSANLTAGDMLLARRRNYLHKSDIDRYTGAASMPGGTLSTSINMEQEPSPDGTTLGQRTWYGYAGKPAPAGEGTNNMPVLIARVLPDGTTNYQYFEYNNWHKVTKEVTTASTDNGIYFRTNTYVYAANGLDQLVATNSDGALEAGRSYNSNHQVLFSTNALGEVTSYSYHSTSRLLTGMRTAAGLTTTNFYDASNRLEKTVQVEINSTNSFTYSGGLVRTSVNAVGLTNTFYFDALQRPVATHFPDGTYTSNLYSRLDLVGSRDRLGNWTTYAFDAAQQRTAVTNSLGKVTQFTYCTCGALEATTDALNNSTSYYYDKAGRNIATVFADGSWVTNNYNVLGQVTSRVDSAGMSLTNYYNNQGLLVASSNAFGRVSKLVYDDHDLVTNAVDSAGVVTVTTYDKLHRPISRSYPDAGVEKFGYSTLGLIAHTNQLSLVTRYFYDVAHRKTSETNANSEVTQFKYDASGNLTNLIDGKGQNTYWRYDVYGRVTNKLDDLKTNLFVYQYDANNRLTNRWTVEKGNTGYSYDAEGNLTNLNYPSSSDITLQYDALNRLTNMLDGVGATAYSYTSTGELLSEDGPWESDTVSYTYFSRMRSGLSLAQPSSTSWSQSYSYDAGRRLSGITSPAGTFSYAYHAGLGSVTAASHLVKSLTLPGGSVITNQFDTVARLTETRLRNNSGTLLNQHDYVYNAGSQRTKQTRTSGDYLDYTYDNIGQLASALGKESGGTTNRWQERFFYSYDKAGNLSNRVQNVQTNVFHVNSLNQLTSVVRTNTSATVAGVTTIAASSVTVAANGGAASSAIRYADRSYARTNVTLSNGTNTFTAVATDSSGRGDTNSVSVYLPVAVTMLYDLNGNLRTNGTRILEYDDENQLTRVTEPSAWKSEFVYDGKLRMRISRDYTWLNGGWTLTNETRRVYDGMLVIQERDQLNTPKLSYTRGKDLSGSLDGAGGIGGLLSLTEHSAQPASFYFHSDGNGNVTALVDTNQNVVARYLYDPFGNTLTANGPKAYLNKYRFSSKELQVASGLVYYGYRFYDPNLQRWPNRDPLGEDGGINLYGFVDNSPLLAVDSFGLAKLWKPCGSTLSRICATQCGFVGVKECRQHSEVQWRDGNPQFVYSMICVCNDRPKPPPPPCPYPHPVFPPRPFGPPWRHGMFANPGLTAGLIYGGTAIVGGALILSTPIGTPAPGPL